VLHAVDLISLDVLSETEGVPSIVLEENAFEVGVGFSCLILGFFSNSLFLPFNLTWMQEAPRLLPNSNSGWINAGKVSPKSLLRLCCCFCFLDHNVTITIRRGSFCIVRPRSCGSGIRFPPTPILTTCYSVSLIHLCLLKLQPL